MSYYKEKQFTDSKGRLTLVQFSRTTVDGESIKQFRVSSWVKPYEINSRTRSGFRAGNWRRRHCRYISPTINTRLK